MSCSHSNTMLIITPKSSEAILHELSTHKLNGLQLSCQGNKGKCKDGYFPYHNEWTGCHEPSASSICCTHYFILQ